jgi:predicted HAD superfamily Cof-like phosphohydrolase
LADPLEMVREFHLAFALPWRDRPQTVSAAERALRQALIQEEFEEFVRAAESDDLVGVADALADLLYVVYGAAGAYGIDIRPVFAEVHRSNMAKVGGRRDARGKLQKPEGWQPPQLGPILRAQGWTG